MTVPSRDTNAALVQSPLRTSSLDVLLIQARRARQMVEQEQQCFAERCRLPRECFRVLNVVRGDEPSVAHLEGADAVLIGGAGAYSAADDYAWTAPLLDLVRRIVDRELPLFGSCWGHQVIARALGGRVEYDPDHAELGCHWVERTAAGRSDVLFHRFPQRFRANMGHHDRVVELPDQAVELARNEIPFQAFKLADRPVYGTQFHSELDAERERERILVYREHYRDALPDEETVRRVLEDLADTTEVDHLLYDFLTTFVARPDPSEVRATVEPPRSLRAHPDGPDGPPAAGRRRPAA
jgi:GMP synthase (glutamine-hydrolysing)